MTRLSNPYAYRITPLLAHLVTAQDNATDSLAHLTNTINTLNRNMDWVDGQMTMLSEFQDRLVRPEQGLTQTIGRLAPHIVQNLAHQRSSLAKTLQT